MTFSSRRDADPDEAWRGDVWTVWAHNRRIAGQIGEVMGRIAAQREDSARLRRQMAARSSDQAQRRRFLSRAQELDRLAQRARRFSAAEHYVARAPGGQWDGGEPTMVAPWSELVAAAPSAIPALRHGIRRWLHQAQWPVDEAADLVLAVNEAVTNAVEHAYPPGGALTVRATAKEVPLAGGLRRARIVITDRGLWRPAPPDPGDRGRGVAMMRTIAHWLHIEPSACGTRVTIASRPVPAAVSSTTWV